MVPGPTHRAGPGRSSVSRKLATTWSLRRTRSAASASTRHHLDLDTIDGPAILVGHSYGGFGVITNAATGSTNVKARMSTRSSRTKGSRSRRLAGADSVLTPALANPTSVFKLADPRCAGERRRYVPPARGGGEQPRTTMSAEDAALIHATQRPATSGRSPNRPDRRRGRTSPPGPSSARKTRSSRRRPSAHGRARQRASPRWKPARLDGLATRRRGRAHRARAAAGAPAGVGWPRENARSTPSCHATLRHHIASREGTGGIDAVVRRARLGPRRTRFYLVAIAVFVVNIAIGILNGADAVEFDRNRIPTRCTRARSAG